MKKIRNILSWILCAAMLVSLCGCTQQPAEETTVPTTQAPTTAPTEPAAQDVYGDARAALDQADHVTLEVLVTTVTEVAGDQFSQQATQTLTYKAMDTEEGVIVCQEDLGFGVHSEDYDPEDAETLEFREVWYQGNLYVEMESTYRYQGPMEKEEVLARYVPAVLLNAELYGSVTSETGADGTTITFGQAAAPEIWALPEDAEMLEASGTALVTEEGTIARMTYTITYQYGPAKVTKTVESKPQTEPKTVTAPANPDTYTAMTYVDALRQYVTAPSLMAQADSVTTSGVESMFSQAAGFLRNESLTVNLYGRKSETKAKFETGVYVMDYSTRQSQKYDLEETFVDGTLTVVEDGGLPTRSSGISWEDVRDVAAEEMLGELIGPDYWKDVTMTDMGFALYLEYDLNDNFGNTIQNGICSMLWNDPNFLIALADDYRNEDLNGYLSIDKYTGLPVASGYYYEGIHTIDGTEYPLTLQYDQSIEAPSKGAYQDITEEMPPEEEPENKATPLFYHVTGENGQEMWLLGTIHVGDERTGFLPEEIYNAFAASDALALECDSEAFDKLLEEDDDLSSEVSNLYFYSDGSTLESVIAKYEEEHPDETEETDETAEETEEEDSYAEIVKLMKATGNYNMNMPYAKPYLWSSSIENFYLRQGYQLHGDQGMEERLCDWAQELGKEIREVESSMFQIKMLTGFSNDLQLMMLGDTVNTDSKEYWTSVMDLYEKWCAGDEAVLREELSDAVDMTDWTEEEIAEYEEMKPLIDEYNKAMSYSRNEGMLKKAIEYLESGDVVFYAVGLAHLLNDVNGLVDALRNAGYTVELVTYG